MYLKEGPSEAITIELDQYFLSKVKVFLIVSKVHLHWSCPLLRDRKDKRVPAPSVASISHSASLFI